MSNNIARQTNRAVKKFHATFYKEFVLPNRTMVGQSLAIFAEDIQSVPLDYVLAGGPSFVRLRYPSMVHARFVLAAIENGGDEDLITMMRIVGTDNPGSKNIKKLKAAAERFFDRVKSLQNEWALSRPQGPVYH